jgi:hypothetical protein
VRRRARVDVLDVVVVAIVVPVEEPLCEEVTEAPPPQPVSAAATNAARSRRALTRSAEDAVVVRVGD